MNLRLIIAFTHTAEVVVKLFESFTFYGYITNSQSDELPDGLIAQSIEHCTGIAEIMA